MKKSEICCFVCCCCCCLFCYSCICFSFSRFSYIFILGCNFVRLSFM